MHKTMKSHVKRSNRRPSGGTRSARRRCSGPTSKVAAASKSPALAKLGRGALFVGAGMSDWEGYSEARAADASPARTVAVTVAEGGAGFAARVAAATVGSGVGSFIPFPIVGTAVGAGVGFGIGYVAGNFFNANIEDSLLR